VWVLQRVEERPLEEQRGLEKQWLVSHTELVKEGIERVVVEEDTERVVTGGCRERWVGVQGHQRCLVEDQVAVGEGTGREDIGREDIGREVVEGVAGEGMVVPDIVLGEELRVVHREQEDLLEGGRVQEQIDGIVGEGIEQGVVHREQGHLEEGHTVRGQGQGRTDQEEGRVGQ
jgi:hypothetical protein